jgi:hypothetical protein
MKQFRVFKASAAHIVRVRADLWVWLNADGKVSPPYINQSTLNWESGRYEREHVGYIELAISNINGKILNSGVCEEAICPLQRT